MKKCSKGQDQKNSTTFEENHIFSKSLISCIGSDDSQGELEQTCFCPYNGENQLSLISHEPVNLNCLDLYSASQDLKKSFNNSSTIANKKPSSSSISSPSSLTTQIYPQAHFPM